MSFEHPVTQFHLLKVHSGLRSHLCAEHPPGIPPFVSRKGARPRIPRAPWAAASRGPSRDPGPTLNLESLLRKSILTKAMNGVVVFADATPEETRLKIWKMCMLCCWQTLFSWCTLSNMFHQSLLFFAPPIFERLNWSEERMEKEMEAQGTGSFFVGAVDMSS